mmetsp:Transcript_107535/g.283566  ORF Transcript_107535/g.283566 Transcript_107535/m.283566 type:complete len:209 (-) Transcript_107535:157-783(-)
MAQRSRQRRCSFPAAGSRSEAPPGPRQCPPARRAGTAPPRTGAPRRAPPGTPPRGRRWATSPAGNCKPRRGRGARARRGRAPGFQLGSGSASWPSAAAGARPPPGRRRAAGAAAAGTPAALLLEATWRPAPLAGDGPPATPAAARWLAEKRPRQCSAAAAPPAARAGSPAARAGPPAAPHRRWSRGARRRREACRPRPATGTRRTRST